jgi:hypothetical protein
MVPQPDGTRKNQQRYTNRQRASCPGRLGSNVWLNGAVVDRATVSLRYRNTHAVAACYRMRYDAALSSTVVIEYSAYHAGRHRGCFRLSCFRVLLLWLSHWRDVSDASQQEFSFHVPKQIASRRCPGISERLLNELPMQ